MTKPHPGFHTVAAVPRDGREGMSLALAAAGLLACMLVLFGLGVSDMKAAGGEGDGPAETATRIEGSAFPAGRLAEGWPRGRTL
jgi:hypothetical protein